MNQQPAAVPPLAWQWAQPFTWQVKPALTCSTERLACQPKEGPIGHTDLCKETLASKTFCLLQHRPLHCHYYQQVMPVACMRAEMVVEACCSPDYLFQDVARLVVL